MFDAPQSPLRPAGTTAAEPPETAADKWSDPRWAWAPYEPDDARRWNSRLAGHLYRRAAFGADFGQLERALDDGPQRTIDRLLQGEADATVFNQTYDGYEAGAASADGLRAWWLRRMMLTPHPLLEKMTLFWHDHFGTSNADVKDARLICAHVHLLRSHALGRFQPLLEGVARDPAVLVGLGCQANRKAQPNENYARALMDNFTLGKGNYAEADLREASRALTGWFVLRSRLRYIEREHDAGTKKVLGREGDFDDKDIARIVLEQPAASRLLVGKLYRWLICETDPPGKPLIAPLAESFAKDYDIGKLVETMLRSNLFFSPAAYRRRIKGPVEFALGIIRGLEGMIPTGPLGHELAALGQNLYHPPTVKGWPGGRHWINHATLLGRSSLAQALLAGKEPYGETLDPLAVARRHGHRSPEAAGRFLLDLFLQGDVEPGVREALLQTAAASDAAAGSNAGQRLRQLAHHVVMLPEFQLA
ncbi:MAG: DUF1800 domain-containing protein [Pirellulales bacterium]|nr:DUF1800 domain-containing protein [Pirellulales bacterium]